MRSRKRLRRCPVESDPEKLIIVVAAQQSRRWILEIPRRSNACSTSSHISQVGTALFGKLVEPLDNIRMFVKDMPSAAIPSRQGVR